MALSGSPVKNETDSSDEETASSKSVFIIGLDLLAVSIWEMSSIVKSVCEAWWAQTGTSGITPELEYVWSPMQGVGWCTPEKKTNKKT